MAGVRTETPPRKAPPVTDPISRPAAPPLTRRRRYAIAALPLMLMQPMHGFAQTSGAKPAQEAAPGATAPEAPSSAQNFQAPAQTDQPAGVSIPRPAQDPPPAPGFQPAQADPSQQ